MFTLLRAVFLLVSLVLVAGCTTRHQSAPDKAPWTSMTILQLQEEMGAGRLTSEALTDFYLRRIQAEDGAYNSVITTNPVALDIARQRDEERKAGQLRGPLHGIPILIKDNIETLDMPTTAGSLAFANMQTGRDATLTANLRNAGAVILGKTNLSEWANMRSERSSSGWSAVGGQTRNPHDPSRTPCGSSSGSGAAVAAGFAVAAIGTETNGSITCPASMNGVVGMKPTVGLVSRFGVVPISHTQDTAGPMTASVMDAAIILAAMQSEDPRDSATREEGITRTGLSDITKTPLSQVRLGWVHSSATRHESVAALEASLIEALKAADVDITDKLSHSPYDGFWNDTYTVLLYEFKHTLNHYLTDLPVADRVKTLESLIAFNQQNREREMPYFMQEIFVKAQEKGTLDEPEYQQALSAVRRETQSGINQLLDDNSADVLIAITRGPAWSIDVVNGDNGSGGVSTYPAVAGYPHITLPLGKVHGLPVGLSVMGKKGDDATVMAIAYQLEAWLRSNPMPEIGARPPAQ
ncbi:amidase [Alteromonas sp. CYL-A6]|uniref:amidase n=1 Tax=Alteromonas nitratireducens TaxID=3390813 RepID=UPI0034AFF652